MDDQPAFGVDFSDWFLWWLNLVGECEQARGRMIDYDMKVVVMLGRSPMELRDHLRAYSALMPLAKSFFHFNSRQWELQRSALLLVILMQLCPRLVGMDRGMRRDTAEERMERKEMGNEQAKVQERTETGKGQSNSGKGNGGWWNEQREQRWTEPFRGYCGHCWKWDHQWQGRRPMELGAILSNPSHSVAANSFRVPLVC